MDSVSDEVRRFLDQNIHCVEQLELLRILGTDRAKEWSIDEISREVQAEPDALATHLIALQTRGLLTVVQRGAEIFCRYGAGTKALEQHVDRLLDAYRHHPVTMIRLVYSRANAALRAFSDAFKFTKEK